MEYEAKEKYYSMLRAFERLKTVSTDNGNRISNTDPQDTAEDFFNQCYHFKDWVKKDSALVLAQDIEDFINRSKSLSLAADYCNSFKHAGLDRESRSGQVFEKMNRHIRFDLTQRGFVASGRLELTIGGKKYDAFSLATDCVEEWDNFLKLNQIQFPVP